MPPQSPDDVNSYFVFFSSQKDAAAAGQCIVFNEVLPGPQHQRVAAQSQVQGVCFKSPALRPPCFQACALRSPVIMMMMRVPEGALDDGCKVKGERVQENLRAALLRGQGAEHAFRVAPAPGPDEVRTLCHASFALSCIAC